MKPNQITTALILSCALALASGTGCKKEPQRLTNLPNSGHTGPGDIGEAKPIDGKGSDDLASGTGVDPNKSGGIPQPPGGMYDNWPADTEFFASDTVHFDFDSSVVKELEKTKVTHVAEYLKAHATDAVRIEGYCDIRGTEEYNRALGERRATALREEMARIGADPSRVPTMSYGSSHPADPANTEEAYRKNRRGTFVLLTPPKP